MQVNWSFSSSSGRVPINLQEELPPVQAVHILKNNSYPISAKRITPGLSEDNARRIKELNREIDGLIGLTRVKHLLKEVQAFISIQKRRESEQLSTDPLVLHTIFKGNPGTGKTTIARLMARLFKEMGVLQKGHLIEVERADLVGEYIGHTAQKTREQLKKAIGGILFVDEAYSLTRGGEKDFGKECIDTLVRSMEEYRNEFVLVLAGYRLEMERFICCNPGLKSRFPLIIDFPDYTLEELMKIADLMLEQRQYCLTAEARLKLHRLLDENIEQGSDQTGNARLVRNLIERSIRRQALRLMNQNVISREDLVLIRRQDLENLPEDL